MDDGQVTEAVFRLARFQENPEALVRNLSPRERLRLSRELVRAFEALDRIDQAFADIEEQGMHRVMADGYHLVTPPAPLPARSQTPGLGIPAF
ncbi:MAG: hypothetical protein HQL82_01485 [Magnetococcales bacterium]|nr:hypothetical protein [Magnetococcales bacterium]